MRRILLLIALLSMVLFVTSCATTPAPAGDEAAPAGAAGEAEGSVLRFAINAGDLGSLDPHFASSTNDRAAVSMVFNGLVRYAPGDAPTLEPDLAVAIPEPQMIDGKQVWTFELNKGVMCQAGPETEAYELTADDVVYSLAKSANADRSAFAGEYAGVTAEKVDDYTVNVTVDPPLSPVLFLPKVADYAGGFIVCSKAIEAMGDEAFKTHPVGTGPFIFDEYTAQDKVSFVANPDYFRSRAQAEWRRSALHAGQQQP